MVRPTTINKRIQLLVEGNDLRNFFEALMKHLSRSGVQILNFGGVRDLPEFLSAFATESNFPMVRSIGIVRDAEGPAGPARQSVDSALGNARLPAPAPVSQASVGSPRVSVFILPDNKNPGMLETLLC